MARKRENPKDIVAKLRQVDALQGSLNAIPILTSDALDLQGVGPCSAERDGVFDLPFK